MHEAGALRSGWRGQAALGGGRPWPAWESRGIGMVPGAGTRLRGRSQFDAFVGFDGLIRELIGFHGLRSVQ